MQALETREPELDALIAAAKAGDLPAFDRLYARCVGRVYALCLRLCADRAEAEALTQDTFVRAWRGLSSFRGESRFTTWLHRLAVNELLQERRAAARRTARVDLPGDVILGQAPAAEDPAGLRLDLERAIATLPTGARHVFVLSAVEGYSHEEVGALLGIAVGTVKAQLHRARALLRERLKETA